jgi:frataxin-like iron-binding protein CyaY
MEATGDWVNSRGDGKLTDMLADELAKATGKTVSLNR